MAAKQRQSSANGSHADVDGFGLIAHQHQELRSKLSALSKFEQNKAMMDDLRGLAHAWARLVSLKENFIYPAFREVQLDEDLLLQTEIRNDLATLLLIDLTQRPVQDRLFNAELKVLLRQMRQALSEEDKKGSGLLAKAKKSGVDTKVLGERMKDLATRFEDMAEDPNPNLAPRYLRSAGRFHQAKENTSMRSNERERDDRGRFVDDDDHRGSRSRGRSSGGQRGQDDSRGWYGDSRGHSQASRRGWEERRGSGRGDDEDDYGSRGRSSGGGGRRHGGWFGDSEGHSQASRRGWENPDHGDSGWFGDREGHSQASRRGWDNPDHGDSGWFGDREGHSQASRRGWDNPDHGDSGWYGDPEGHSEASRRGWESRSSSRRDDDDDDYRDRRRSSRRR